MMTAEQQAGLERFAHFLGEMIAKYGVDVAKIGIPAPSARSLSTTFTH